jgi:hypothetical protein
VNYFGGQPNDIATATGLVTHIYGVVKAAYLKAQDDAQAAKAAQPAPAPTQLVFCTRVHWGGRHGCSGECSLQDRAERCHVAVGAVAF